MNRFIIASKAFHNWIFAKGRSGPKDAWDYSSDSCVYGRDIGLTKNDIFEFLPYKSPEGWALFYCKRLDVTGYFHGTKYLECFSPAPVDVNKFWAKFNES